MLKLILAAAAFILCMAAGKVAAEKYGLRQRVLNGLVSDFKVLEAALKYERTDIKSLADLLAARGSLTELWKKISYELERDAGFGAAWRRHGHELLLENEALAVVDGFAKRFGSNDAETELGRIAGTLRQLEEIERKQCAVFEQKRKLSRSLSALLGAALALLII